MDTINYWLLNDLNIFEFIKVEPLHVFHNVKVWNRTFTKTKKVVVWLFQSPIYTDIFYKVRLARLKHYFKSLVPKVIRSIYDNILSRIETIHALWISCGSYCFTMTYCGWIERFKISLCAFMKLQGYFLNGFLVDVTVKLHGPFYVFWVIEMEPFAVIHNTPGNFKPNFC